MCFRCTWIRHQHLCVAAAALALNKANIWVGLDVCVHAKSQEISTFFGAGHAVSYLYSYRFHEDGAPPSNELAAACSEAR